MSAYQVVLWVILIPIIGYMIMRLVKSYINTPMPAFMADLIDNPLRRKIQPPAEMPSRLGLKPGMRVLEVGPGNGRYTVEAARHLGSSGKVIAVDIEPAMLRRVRRRAQSEPIDNLHTSLVDVHALPFNDTEFDAVYMICVFGEIPNPQPALLEFHRVLAPHGTLAFSELLPDPDFPSPRKLIQMAEQVGFHQKNRAGNWLTYTLVFEKD
jgi:ubiquinone/menaquinone biosynthesis C-methylase UbiE